MATVTTTPDGTVIFDREVFHHLGIQPGDPLSIDLLPNGQAALHAPPVVDTSTQSVDSPAEEAIDKFIGVLKGKTIKVATLEEIEKAIQDGWAGLV